MHTWTCQEDGSSVRAETPEGFEADVRSHFSAVAHDWLTLKGFVTGEPVIVGQVPDQHVMIRAELSYEEDDENGATFACYPVDDHSAPIAVLGLGPDAFAELGNPRTVQVTVIAVRPVPDGD